MQKQERQNILLNLISAKPIGRQDELAKLLRKNGFSVTQASISRDLEELGIVKLDGIYKRPSRPAQAAEFGLISLDTAGDNLIVARCGSGLASAITVRIDAARIAEIVGTIAGDDTIFIALKDSTAQKIAIRKIWSVFEDWDEDN